MTKQPELARCLGPRRSRSLEEQENSSLTRGEQSFSSKMVRLPSPNPRCCRLTPRPLQPMPSKAKKKKNRKKRSGGVGEEGEEDEFACYRCVELPNKGMGMLATRAIACGEVILEVNTQPRSALRTDLPVWPPTSLAPPRNDPRLKRQ